MYLASLPETVAAAMSFYWPAGHYPQADAQRDRQRIYSLSIVATHSKRLVGTHRSRGLCSPVQPDRSVGLYTARSPKSLGTVDVFVHLWSVTLGRVCEA